MPLPASQRHGLVGSNYYWKLKREFQISFLINYGLKPTDRFLDYGCGTLRGGIPIIEYLEARCYTGVDIRVETIEEARHELQDNRLANKRPRLGVIRSADQTPMGPYDIIWIFDTIIHLRDDIADYVFAMCRSRLADGGSAIFNANVSVELDDASWQGFPVVFRTDRFYHELADRHQMSLERLGTLQSFGHDNGDALQNGQVLFRMVPHEDL